MLKGTELRIGNKFNGIARVQTVRSIIDFRDRGDYGGQEVADYGYKFLITVQENRNQYKPCDIEPIPLTPEILEKAAFKKSWYENVCQYELDIFDSVSIFNGDKNGITEAVFEVAGVELKRCRYLHQLQNLYYALTNTELEITF